MSDSSPGPTGLPLQPDPAERRRGTRVGLAGDAVVHVRSHAFQCSAVDVAEGGIRLRGKWWARPGEYARVRFRLRQRDIVALGRVAWRRPGVGGAEFGLSFMTVADEHRHELARFIEEAQPRPAVVEPEASWEDEPGTHAGQTWHNPPTVELPGSSPGSAASAHPTVLDTLPGAVQAEASEEPETDGPQQPPSGEPPPAQPARRPRIRHRVTMHDLWMVQIREWSRTDSDDQ